MLIDSSVETERLITRLRFRHLRLITELQRGGSLRIAAQALNQTQPALSKALGELEGAFGFAIFVRTSRGVTPTAQGEVVIRGAAMLLEELAHLQTEAGASETMTPIVRVGAPPFLAQSYLPEVLERLTRSEPRVRVKLVEERVPLLLEALAQGRLDALVTSYPAQMPDLPGVRLHLEKLFDAKFVVIAAPGHPLSRARQVDWHRLAREPWIMPARTSMLRRLIEESFMRAGAVPPVPVVESTSPVTNVQLVAAGLGLSAAPEATMRPAQAMGQVVKIKVSPVIATSPVALVYRQGVANPRVALLRHALGFCAADR